MIVYKICNNFNNKIYVGLTRNSSIKQRINKHIVGNNKQKNSVIHTAITKYGIENFTIVELEVCNSIPHLIEREKYWINYFNCCNKKNGYNVTNGGEGCRIRLGYKLTEEHKNKLSIAKIGNKCHLGKLHSEETKIKISKNRKGIVSDYTSNKSKKVLCIDSQIVYRSIEEAARETGAYPQNIRKVCIGQRNTTMGLKYKYYYE